MSRRLPVLLPILLGAVALAGCVDAEEDWTFDDKGGGTYALTLRWNADLWRRASDVLGPGVMTRLQGRPFPLRAAQWRDGLAALKGVEILELAERDTDTGLREVALRVRFTHLRDLLRWEVLRRRTVRVEIVPQGEDADESPPHCRVYMEPIAQVPVLDRLAALLDAVETPPPRAEGPAAARDPPPLERLGLDRGAADMVWRMVKKPLQQVRLRLRFRAPGRILTHRGRPVRDGSKPLEVEYDFAALRKPETDRTVPFTWQMRAFDQAPVVDQQGDRDPRRRRVEAQGR